MTAISSHRPSADDPEYFERQRLARLSWVCVFDRVIYLGPPEMNLAFPETKFVPSEPFPTIKRLVSEAKRVPRAATIINSDIFLLPQIRRVIDDVEKKRVAWASSRRWWFKWDSRPVHERLAEGTVRDAGRDIWIAAQEVWERVERLLPDATRIGHQRCDDYLFNALSRAAGPGLDVTGLRLVYHPEHQPAYRPDPVKHHDIRRDDTRRRTVASVKTAKRKRSVPDDAGCAEVGHKPCPRCARRGDAPCTDTAWEDSWVERMHRHD